MPLFHTARFLHSRNPRGAFWGLSAAYNYLAGGAEKMEPDSSQMCTMKGQESTNKGCNMGHLSVTLQGQFLHEGGQAPGWEPRKVVRFPSLEIFRNQTDTALKNLTSFGFAFKWLVQVTSRSPSLLELLCTHTSMHKTYFLNKYSKTQKILKQT